MEVLCHEVKLPMVNCAHRLSQETVKMGAVL